ncbi:hypothetical protein CRG98_040681 [Punica granatum]|uniref:Uncharacterized protein n=1 Tax=Punica granatum TaxID=22663 RepID=A0A2I0I4H4_PUNGR|nr:hypothetical protein CRG98_040681 [Punica granatum]
MSWFLPTSLTREGRAISAPPARWVYAQGGDRSGKNSEKARWWRCWGDLVPPHGGNNIRKIEM